MKYQIDKKYIIIVVIFSIIFSSIPSNIFAVPSNSLIPATPVPLPDNTESIPEYMYNNPEAEEAIQKALEITNELEEKNKTLEMLYENNVVLKERISSYKEEIETIRSEIEELQIKASILKSQVSLIMVDKYKAEDNSDIGMISSILDSKNITEFFTKIEYFSLIYDQESNALNRLEERKDEINEKQSHIEMMQETLRLFEIQYENTEKEIELKIEELETEAKENEEFLIQLRAIEELEQRKYLEKITAHLETGEISEKRVEVVNVALSQLGKPYVWGAIGPNSFDCSGLMQYSYKQIGINILRTSRQQYSSTKKITVEELQPGDLVFIGKTPATIHHVMMYIGNGYTVEAPSSGDVVKIRPLIAREGKILGYTSVFP